MVGSRPRGPEDRALESCRGDQLPPRDTPVLALRRLPLVDQPPHLLEDLLRKEAGDQTADDAEGREEEARHDSQYCGEVPGAGFEPACPEGQGGLSAPRITNFATRAPQS